MSRHNDDTAKGTVNITFQMPRQRIRDIMTTAFEQGIGYWASDEDFEGYDAVRDEKGFVKLIVIKPRTGSKFPAIDRTLRAPAGYFGVRDADLARAFGRALTQNDNGEFVNKGAGAAAAAELAGDFDASTADVLVQFAFFGEVVYG